MSGATDTIGGYLSDNEQTLIDGVSCLRVRWADELCKRINHTGWWTDEHGATDTIRGMVALLPNGRFLPGWSMGAGMCTTFERESYDDITDAAMRADDIAGTAAEREQEYMRVDEAAQRIRQHREEIATAREDFHELAQEYRTTTGMPVHIWSTVRNELKRLRADVSRMADLIRQERNEFGDVLNDHDV